MDLSAFYGILAGLSFTLLGLWWVACQAHRSWIDDRGGRAMAYVVSLHFVLPGAMSLLSLVAPEVPAMWRITFTVAGVLGAVGTVLLIATMRRRTADTGLLTVLQWFAVPIYAAVAVVAAVPGVLDGFGLAPLQVEATLLVILILLGTQEAWLVTFAREADSGAPD